jgi:hypothetical protein
MASTAVEQIVRAGICVRDDALQRRDDEHDDNATRFHA